MLIAVAQVNPTVGDLASNVTKILDFALRAEAAGARLVLFPELSICGYPPRDLVQCNGFADDNCRALRQLARSLPKKMTAIVGHVARSRQVAGKPFVNMASVLQDGKIVYEQAKILLPTYDVFDEQRNFEPGGKPRVIRVNGLRVGITVCEDCWNDKNFWKRPLYRRDPVEEIASSNPHLLVNISASPYAFGKRAFRCRMLQAIAKHYRVPVAFVNMVGGNDSLVFDCSSLVLGKHGKVRFQSWSLGE